MKLECLLTMMLLSASASAEPLSLETALSTAKSRHPALLAARAGKLAALARTKAAFAPLLPTVSAGLQYSRSTANFVGRPGSVPQNIAGASTVTLNSFDFWSGNMTAQATVWDFLQTYNRYQASLSTADAQAAQVRAAEVAVALGVRTTWHSARAQRDLVQVARDALINAEAHLAQVQGFVSVGSRADIDLAQSRAEKANARLALLNAQNAEALALARLNQAMGVEGPAPSEVGTHEETSVEGEAQPHAALVDEAWAGRAEAKALDAQARAQEATLRSLRGAYAPTLGVQVQGTASAQTLAAVVPNVSAQVTLNWPIWQGGLTNAQVAEAEASLRQLEAQRSSLRLQVELDVETAIRSVDGAREAVAVSAEVREAADERLRLAEGRYVAGVGSSLEREDARVAATMAAAQQVQARASLAIARAQLLAALGRD